LLMSYEPLFHGSLEVTERKVGSIVLKELSEKGIDNFFARAPKIQEQLSRIPVEERLAAIEEVGRTWAKRLGEGGFNELKVLLSKSTGYSQRMIENEFSLVPSTLNGINIKKNLQSSFGKMESLQEFVEISEGEYCRQLPAGPVFIISSGNSLIPPLIPTTLSLATGNLTMLRPSMANYKGLIEIYRLFQESGSATLELISEALTISYFTHDSPGLRHLLSKSAVGVINFWGGEPARTEVGRVVSQNVHHPRFIVNGPMTGFAVIDDASASEQSARDLAKNMVLYDQQLCSSPTMAAFIGSFERGMEFSRRVGEWLDREGGPFEMKLSDASAYALNSARRVLQIKGSPVISSRDPKNMWTVVLSKDKSALDGLTTSIPEFGLHSRRRFIEIIAVPNAQAALERIATLPTMKSFSGIDRVQTVGLAVSPENKRLLLELLMGSGVYRILPLKDMFMRSPREPYDGINLAAAFTYMVYHREKEITLPSS